LINSIFGLLVFLELGLCQTGYRPWVAVPKSRFTLYFAYSLKIRHFLFAKFLAISPLTIAL
jgi:hypothetical protein